MTEQGEKSKVEQILSEIETRRKATILSSINEEKVKVVLFRLHDDYYAFFGEDIKSILPIMDITFVPGIPDFIYGIINNRGDIESVLNIHQLIGIPKGVNSKDTRIIIAAKDETRSGILVDSVEEVIDIPQNDIKPPIATIDKSIKDFVAGEFIFNNNHVTIIDIGMVFGRIAS